jgi:type IV secretion system protein VirB9
MQVCDVELEQGETVHEIVIGDSARWMVDSGTVGSGAGATAHLFIKPVDAGLESSAIVTTDRRVYHLRLVSQRSGHTPYVGFLYADALRRQNASRQAQTAKEREWAPRLWTEGNGLVSLNFIWVTGKAGWKPERVYDAGGRDLHTCRAESSKSGKCPCFWCARASRTCW